MHQVFLAKGLKHDSGRGQRQDHADRQCGLPGHVEGVKADDHDQRHGHGDLKSAEAHQPVPHVPERPRAEFKPDQEQHQDDAEFRKVLKVFGFRHEAEYGADDDARDQVAQHRAKPEAHRKRHGDDRGGQVNHGLEQKTFHQSPSFKSATARRP